MNTLTYARFVIGTVLALVAIVGRAWDSGEFRSGASQDQVLERLRSQSFKIQQIGPTSYFAGRPNEAYSLAFCNGRLTYHSSDVRGGIRGFIRRVGQLSKKYGSGSLATLNSETDSGEMNMLSVTWQVGADTLRVSYFAKTDRISESQAVAWFAPSECQDRLK